ncbi:MAG: ribulose-phosphate 3-epimerase [Erysipelotrichaceae bacterium]|nr:ribulose-phosphate 3-epimerase [Erysipelotrichaceae bacterium]
MEKKIIRVAPSFLAADFKFLDKEMKRVIKAKADWIHLDIMDGKFVNNISFGFPILNAIKDYPIFKDVHLMIEEPLKYLNRFIDEKADLITFHIEAIKYKKDVKQLIKTIHQNNIACGISIKPSTKVDVLMPFLKDIDLVLIMSVEPGFGGQSFDESSLEKISELRKIVDENNYNCLIEVDGGINDKTYSKVINAGADVLVSGSFLFKSANMKESIKLLKGK